MTSLLRSEGEVGGHVEGERLDHADACGRVQRERR